MRCATVLVVRVLANGCSELAHPRKLFCCAGFQPAILALSEMLAGPPLSGQTRMPAPPLISQCHYGVNGSQKNQPPAKAECAPAASRATSGAGVPGASVAGFRRRCRGDRRERDARPAAIRRRNAAKALFAKLRIAEAVALPGWRFEKRRGLRRSRKAAAACFLLRSAKQFREPSQRQRLRPRLTAAEVRNGAEDAAMGRRAVKPPARWPSSISFTEGRGGRRRFRPICRLPAEGFADIADFVVYRFERDVIGHHARHIIPGGSAPVLSRCQR